MMAFQLEQSLLQAKSNGEAKRSPGFHYTDILNNGGGYS